MSAPAADAATPDEVVVSADAADWTPWVNDGEVRAIVEIGSRVIVGGTFTQAQEPGGGATTRNYLFAFDRATGRIDDTFAPVLDGPVHALAVAPDGNVFAGGAFSTVNGATRKGVVKLHAATGGTVSSFGARAAGAVLDLALHGNRLFLAGYFGSVNGVARTRAAAVDATTGALDPGFDFAFSDPMSTAYVTGSLQVTDLAITPDGSRLVALGNFTKVNGVPRYQVAVFDLWTSPATLADWSTAGYQPTCPSRSTAFYVRDVAFDPTGTFFVIVTGGAWGRTPTSLCDSTARWEIGRSGSGIQPTWIDATGGDTLHTVAVTGTAVYVGGHQRWHNNPYAGDKAGPGAVPRSGIAALDPRNGVPLSWNPGREPGDGVKALVPTSTGLWVGSDTNVLGGEWHPRLGFFPVTGGRAVPEPTIASLPGALHKAGPNDLLTRQPFDGTTIGTAETVTSGTPAWSQARGGYLVGGKLFSGWNDGKLYVRDYDGQTLGSATAVPLNGLATHNFPVTTLTGSFIDPATARLYYTQSGDPNLYYRGFTLESQILGALRYTAPAGGIDWSVVRGMTLASGRIYYADTSGNLRSVEFSDGAPTGTPVLVSGPAKGDGRTWNANGLFVAGVSAEPPPAEPEYVFTGTGSSTFGSWKVHSFEVGTVPKRLLVRLDWDNAGADLNLFLKNPAGTTVAFANGTTSKPEVVDYTATTTGTWTVAVSIKAGTAAYELVVNPPTTNATPAASFTSACTGLSCSFDAGGSSDVDGTIASYGWDFGDGTVGSGVNVEHAYPSAGTYTAVLTVTDDDGAAARTTRAVTIANAEYRFSGSGSPDSKSWQLHSFAVTDVPKRLVVRLDWDNAAADLNVFLYNPSGTLVASANGTTNKPETLAYDATTTGTWTVAVKIKLAAASYELLINPF